MLKNGKIWLLLGAFCVATAAFAGPSGVIQSNVAVCDPNAPNNCLAPSGGGFPSSPGTTRATGAVTCATTPTQIVGARPGRKSLIVKNLGGGAIVYVGDLAVTAASGQFIDAVIGAGLGYSGGESAPALFCVVASGTQELRFEEVY